MLKISGHLPGSSQREARAKPQARAPLSHRMALTPHGSSHGAAQPQPHAVQNPAGSTPSATKALGPTLRANPCPEVTDPFCRLPLSALFYSTRGCSPRRPAAVIGTARLHVLISPSGFQGSAATHRMPRTKRGTLPVVPPYLRANRFQGRSDCQEEKTTLPGMAVDVPELDRVAACTGVRVQEFSPGSLSARGAARTANRPKLPSDGVYPCLRTD